MPEEVETQVAAIGEPPVTEPLASGPGVSPAPVSAPGTEGVDARELTWLRQQHAQALSQLQQVQSQLQEYETAAMTDDERSMYEVQQQREALEQQQSQLAEVMYANDLHAYYSEFVPASVIKGDTPSDWQDNVLKYLAGEVRRLQAELAKTKVAMPATPPVAKPGANAPRVSTPAGKGGKKSIWDTTREEREAIMQRALDGQISAEDYPAID